MSSPQYPILITDPETQPIPVEVIAQDAFAARGDTYLSNLAKGQGFAAKLGQVLLVPGADGTTDRVLFGWGTAAQRKRSRLHLGAAPVQLPDGIYALAGAEAEDEALLCLSWLLGQYRFGRYNGTDHRGAQLVCPEGVDAVRANQIAEGAFRAMDLINTPAGDLGPNALEVAMSDMAAHHGATLNVVKGTALLEQNFPMIHAVGRAAAEEPRLLQMRWGDQGPKITLVGKGVCFDTGGLNLKPGNSMALMKKDMSGAANVLGLAHMIMAMGLRVQLTVLIPAVENAVSAGAFRPGDILTSRKGLTVEINNTDAEGRLVLADALQLGGEDAPDLMVCMASLTGAARVAVGGDLSPFYTDDATLSAGLRAEATKVEDPLWEMPFWDPYEPQIEPGIADLDNAPAGGFAGSITAALFLRRFAEGAQRFVHLDIYGWSKSDQPGRPKGGAAMGIRALLPVIEAMANDHA